jgi:hypothetical protein
MTTAPDIFALGHKAKLSPLLSGMVLFVVATMGHLPLQTFDALNLQGQASELVLVAAGISGCTKSSSVGTLCGITSGISRSLSAKSCIGSIVCAALSFASCCMRSLALCKGLVSGALGALNRSSCGAATESQRNG